MLTHTSELTLEGVISQKAETSEIIVSGRNDEYLHVGWVFSEVRLARFSAASQPGILLFSIVSCVLNTAHRLGGLSLLVPIEVSFLATAGRHSLPLANSILFLFSCLT